MIEAQIKDDEFLQEVRALRSAGGARVWWLGQSGFLVQWNGGHCLIDPYLSDSLTRKYAATDKPHVRMTERVVDPGKLGFIDVVSSSHNHTDHLDGETLGALMRVNAGLRLVAAEANRAFAAERAGIGATEVVGVDVGKPVVVAGFEFHAVSAAHETVELDERGRHKFVGFVVRFGRRSLYHSGDTVPFEGLADWVRGFKVDVALLPINGRGPERRVAGNLWGDEAARLAKEIGAKRVVPCHYEMFEFNTEPPDLFVKECEKIGQPYTVLRAGGRLEI